MDIKEEIKIILLKKKISMRSLVGQMNIAGFEVGSVQNLSNKFRNETIRFNEVEDILNYLGFEFKIVPKN